MLRKYIDVSDGVLPLDDKDHYINKRLKLSGDLLADLFRVNLKVLIGDLLYNFQRIVKRGKFPSIKVIIRDKLPFPLPRETEALLLLEVDGSSQSVISQASALKKYLETSGGLLEVKEARNENEVAALWTARRAVSPAAFELKPHKTSEDVVVPRTKIPELVLHTEHLAQKNQLPIFTFARIRSLPCLLRKDQVGIRYIFR